jgi:anti-anti-sigma factor
VSIKISRNEHFTFIVYERTEKGNYDEIRNAMQELLTAPTQAPRDVVIDLTRCRILFSPELGAIAKVLTYLTKSEKHLRIIASPEITKMLYAQAFTKIKSLVIYESLAVFLEEVKQSHNKPLPIPSTDPQTTVVRLKEDLTGEKVQKMTAEIESALNKLNKSVAIDLSGVKLLDSSGLAQLLYLDSVAKNKNKSLVLSGLNPEVLALIKDAHLEMLFTIQY